MPAVSNPLPCFCWAAYPFDRMDSWVGRPDNPLKASRNAEAVTSDSTNSSSGTDSAVMPRPARYQPAPVAFFQHC